MKALLIAALTMGAAFSAHASNLNCLKLTERVSLALGKANSGPAMILKSVKPVSIRKTEYNTTTYKFQVFLKDANTDMYDGYYVTAQTFSGGDANGCLIQKVVMFQND